MIDFKNYINTPVVLITNEVSNLKEIENMDLTGTILIIESRRFPRTYGLTKKFCLARRLTEEDLTDEDFVINLNNIWKKEAYINIYLDNFTIIQENDNQGINFKA